MNAYLIIAVIFICLILEALYSGGEVALFSSDINKMKFLAGRGSSSAGEAVKLLEKPEWFISTTLIGTNLSIIIASTLATGLFISYFGVVRGEQISLIVMLPTLFVMIIVRSVFQHYAETMAIKVAYFIRLSSVVFYPAAYIIAAVSKETVRFSTDQKVKQASYITKEGLKFILGEKTKGSDILKTEREMVSRVFDFSELTADKIMVPISALTALPIGTKIEEAVQVFTSKKYLRIPVYEDTVYNIIGILHYFDLLETLIENKDNLDNDSAVKTIASCMQTDVFYVPETKKASELLMDMQRRHEHMTIIVDEYGGAIGIVTIEDIGEEIVGSIDDEYTTGEKLYKRIAPGRYLVNGRMEMEDLNQVLSMKFPDGNYETLGGFLMNRMGRIPQRRERLEYNGITFIIENADQKSVKEVLVIFPAQLDKLAIK
jgi:Hemolysins and related proteins containing CBS domains